MAGDPGLNWEFHLSGGTSNLEANDSVGGGASNFRIDRGVTTISAVGAAGDTRVFLTLTEAAHGDEVLSIRNGASGGFYTRILDANPGGGYVDILDPLPNSVAIGDGVYSFNPGNIKMPWHGVTAQESSDGFVQYFAGYFLCTAGAFTDWGVHIEEHTPGNVIHEIAVASDPFPPNLNASADRFTAPDLSLMMTGGITGSFVRPLSAALRTPKVSVSGFTAHGFWIKRTLPANSRKQTDQIVSLVLTDSGSLVANCVLVWDTPGFTPVVELKQSPSIYLGGGARFRANVKSAESGLNVEGIPVSMRKVSGPGTFTVPPAPAETDDDGNVIGHYSATTNPGDIGATVTVEAEV